MLGQFEDVVVGGGRVSTVVEAEDGVDRPSKDLLTEQVEDLLGRLGVREVEPRVDSEPAPHVVVLHLATMLDCLLGVRMRCLKFVGSRMLIWYNDLKNNILFSYELSNI